MIKELTEEEKKEYAKEARERKLRKIQMEIDRWIEQEAKRMR